MARSTYGGTSSDVATVEETSRTGQVSWVPAAGVPLDVRRADTGAAVTDVVPPPGWNGATFPSGRALADRQGLVRFLGPDGLLAPLEVRVAARPGYVAGSWVRLTGQPVQGGGGGGASDAQVDAALARAVADDRVLTPPTADQRYASAGGTVVDASRFGSLQAAVDAAGTFAQAARVHVRGRVPLTATLVLPDGVTLGGDGSTELVLAASVNGPAVRAVGSIAAPGSRTATLSADATKGTRTLTVASSSGVAVGDVLILGAEVFPDPTQSTRRAGELVRVTAVSEQTITLARPTYDGYTVATTGALWKITPRRNVAVENLSVTREGGMGGTASGHALLDFYCVEGPRVSNVQLHDHTGPAITLQFAWDATVTGGSVTDLADDQAAGKYGYGVNVGGGVDNLSVTGTVFRRVRHAITTNGSSHHGGSTGLVFTGLVATECTNAAFDTHAWGMGVVFDGCLAQGCAAAGFTVRSSRTTLTGCQAVACGGMGFLVAETVATDVTLTGCVAVDCANGIVVREDGPRGLRILDCLVDRVQGTGIQVASGCHDVVIKGNTVLNVGLGPSQGLGIHGTATGSAPVPGTGWLVQGNTLSKTGTAGTYRQGVLLVPAITGVVADNHGTGTRTDLPFVVADSARQRDNTRLDQGTARVDGTAPPTTGTWQRGDEVRNTTPTAGGVPGWVCVTAGTPGTWRAMAALAA